MLRLRTADDFLFFPCQVRETVVVTVVVAVLFVCVSDCLHFMPCSHYMILLVFVLLPQIGVRQP